MTNVDKDAIDKDAIDKGAVDKTLMHDDWPDVPAIVRRAVDLAKRHGFARSCAPTQGELLRVLARGRDGGAIGETGTGCGVGLAWMLSAVAPDTRLVSIELSETRAAACQELFADFSNVTVLQGDWRTIVDHGPFDLLVLDGGGGGKRAEDRPADLAALLKPGGTVVLDDMYPAFDAAPNTEQDAYGRDVATARAYWLARPELHVTEIKVHPLVGALIGTRRMKD